MLPDTFLKGSVARLILMLTEECLDIFFTFSIIHPHIRKSAEVNMKLFTDFPIRQD